jgi:osmotically inducible protein OsmC
MAAERTATCLWHGELTTGVGAVSSHSGAFAELPVSWASRTSRADEMTSPEELIAAAHASCFAMALSHGLTEAGHSPEQLQVSATVTLDEIDGAPTVTTSEIMVEGVVPGLEAVEFIQIATDAGANCPVSRALGSLDIHVTATLVDAAE